MSAILTYSLKHNTQDEQIVKGSRFNSLLAKVGFKPDSGCNENWLVCLIGLSVSAMLIDFVSILAYNCKSFIILLMTYVLEMIYFMLYFVIALILLY
jgi:hypothetical protein